MDVEEGHSAGGGLGRAEQLLPVPVRGPVQIVAERINIQVSLSSRPPVPCWCLPLGRFSWKPVCKGVQGHPHPGGTRLSRLPLQRPRFRDDHALGFPADVTAGGHCSATAARWKVDPSWGQRSQVPGAPSRSPEELAGLRGADLRTGRGVRKRPAPRWCATETRMNE